MAVCAKSVLQPDGSYLLALEPSVTDTSMCAYVVETGGSNAWRELGNMTIGNAEVISAHVCFVWVIAWGFRAIRSALSTNEGNLNE